MKENPDFAGTTFRLPTQVHFLMNDTCNSRCVMCGGDYFNSRSGRRITLEKFRRMAANLRLERFSALVLSGAGDPLLNPDLVPIIREANGSYPGVRVMITTNGIALTRELAGILQGLRVSHVNVSINAATRETYRRIMQVDRFEEVCRNAANFRALGNLRPARPCLQFSCAVHRGNIEELPALVELGRRIGIDSINILYCRFYPEGIRNPDLLEEGNRLADSDSLYFHQELSDRMIREARALARRHGIHFTHEPLFGENAPGRTCHWHESEIMVGFDGEIYPCGGAEIHFREKVEKGIYRFGNALTDSIDDFWNGKMYRALRLSSRGEGDDRLPECSCCANVMRPNDVRSHIMGWNERTGDPLVSVIVPTHDRPELLATCLKSILAQTFTRYEVVVVNDGGREAEEIVAGLNTQGNLTYVRHGGNRGLAAARNTGIRLARGRYIAYLDDDDLYYPDHLQTLVDATEGGKYRVVYSDAHRVTQFRIDGEYVETGREVQYSFDFDGERILIENYIPVLCFLHEKSCIEESGPFDESLKVLEDWDLWIRMSRRQAFRHVPRVTCAFTWREDGSSMTSSRLASFRDTTMKIYAKYAEFSRNAPHVMAAQERVRRSHLANRLIGLAIDKYRAGKGEEAVRDLEGLLAVDRGNALTHKELGVLHYYMGDHEKAAAHLEASIAIDGNMAARKDLARLHMALGRAEDVVSACEGILAKAPRDIECLGMLKKVCTDLGLKDKARLLHERIARISREGRKERPACLPIPEAAGRDAVHVSVIVPVFNKVEFTRDCIAALWDTSSDVPYELIVVDNGSEDGTAEYLRSLSGKAVVISNRENLGFAAACNQGARAARGDLLVFLNNDTVPRPGWLSALVGGAREDVADICGSRLLYPNGKVQHAGIAFHDQGDAYHVFRNLPGEHPAANRKRWMQCVTGACMLVRRDMFLELGGFDEGYRNGYEDVDFCLRAKERGLRTLYVPESVVVHYEEVTDGRKEHDKRNLERYLSRWKGRVDLDLVRLYEEEGYEKKTAPDGELVFVHRSAAAAVTEGSSAKGRVLKKEKRFVEAFEAFEEARAAGDRSVLADMGDCLAQTGEPGEAERFYREALREEPGDGRAMVGLGVLAMLAGGDAAPGEGRARAAEWFRAALERNGRDAAALCGLGLLLRTGGDPSGAFDLYRRALAADPVNLPALHELVTSAYELRRLDEAEEHLSEYLMYRPSDANILYALAGLRYAAGKREEALGTLDRLEAFAPDFDGAVELRERIAGA
jgi:GT2 family glycosyltransferase/MoaA/NifB/PqqE/SkfB family radical SAM enzyme/predicted Zn-dependent protease